MPKSLRNEIYRRAHYVEPQGDFIEMVLIRMDAIEEAVNAWDRGRRRLANRRKKHSAAKQGKRPRG
ncbi:hypothetical protein CI1B_49150 [Bradyrhizobium ivorense]|uniref:Uncharacterized protein n=1 Tax=Bradyrhizobium ivorense TaxID=2511166 RepID=A0A508TFN6_9BRAD|nr:hypothetical protein CI1B_49150 [Bradyrhizobium ivorense]